MPQSSAGTATLGRSVTGNLLHLGLIRQYRKQLPGKAGAHDLN